MSRQYCNSFFTCLTELTFKCIGHPVSLAVGVDVKYDKHALCFYVQIKRRVFFPNECNVCQSKGQLLVFVFEPCCPAHIALHTVLFVLVILSK